MNLHLHKYANSSWSSWWALVLRLKTSKTLFGLVKIFSFYLELYKDKFKYLIRTSKFKFSFRGLQQLHWVLEFVIHCIKSSGVCLSKETKSPWTRVKHSNCKLKNVSPKNKHFQNTANTTILVNIPIISLQWNKIIYIANSSKLFHYQKLEVNLT